MEGGTSAGHPLPSFSHPFYPDLIFFPGGEGGKYQDGKGYRRGSVHRAVRLQQVKRHCCGVGMACNVGMG